MRIRTTAAIFAFVIALAGCKDKSKSAASSDPAGKTTESSEPPPPGKKSDSEITWIEDDFAAALAAAKKDKLPLVVDMWAPWCHTCLSMKGTVLNDAGLAGHAQRFVFVALDTDKPENAAAVAKLPVAAWPTFFVVAPDESVAGRFVGSASVKQFRDFLDESERAASADLELEEGTSAWHLRAGDQLAAAGENAKAAEAYGRALEEASPSWPRRADVLVSQIGALYKAGDHAGCAALGKAKIEETLDARSASTPDFAYYATSCADAIKGGEEAAAELRAAAMVAIRDVAFDEDAHLSADDRSDALRILRELTLAGGDKAGAIKLAEKQLAILEEAAAAAADPFYAMAYNWPRSEVYVYLGRGEALVESLRKSAADLPKEYDPPYRLAWVLLQIGKADEALAAVEKAEALAYGPRKGRVLDLKAQIYEAKSDKPGAIAAREAMIAHYESLPVGQKSEPAIEAAKKALAAMK